MEGIIKVCKMCKKKFLPKDPRKIYCGPICFNKSKKNHPFARSIKSPEVNEKKAKWHFSENDLFESGLYFGKERYVE